MPLDPPVTNANFMSLYYFPETRYLLIFSDDKSGINLLRNFSQFE